MGKSWKSVLTFVAIVLLAIVAVSALVKVNNLETTSKLNSWNYSVGALSTETGKIISAEDSIYTKKAFTVEDLTIEVDDDSSVSYRLFYYNDDNDFISASSLYTADFDSSTIPSEAAKAKIVVIPDDEDGSISSLELVTYAGLLSVTYAKS